MSCRRSGPLALLAAVLLLAAPARAAGPALPEVPAAYVVDLAEVVDAGAEARLNALLGALEARTSAQAVVLTVDSLEGRAIEEFSLDVAHNRWRLGQAGRDNGLLLTLAVRDRRYRFEVGYGLEGLLPDSAVGTIGRQLLVPALRRGDYGAGIEAAMGAVAAQVAGAAGVELPDLGPMPAPVPGAGPRGGRQPGPLDLLVAFLIAVGLLYLFVRHPRLFILLLLFSRGGGSGRGWGGGGGFGGGGGGGFGGGGASGSW